MSGHHVRGSDQADRQGGIDHEDVQVAVVIGGQDAGSPDRQVFSPTHVQTEYQMQKGPQHQEVHNQGQQSCAVQLP